MREKSQGQCTVKAEDYALLKNATELLPLCSQWENDNANNRQFIHSRPFPPAKGASGIAQQLK